MAFRVLNREQSLQIIDALDIEADYSPTKLTDRKQSREDILKALLNLENNKELDRDTKRKYRIEQSLLREFLFNGKNEVICACRQTKLSPEFLQQLISKNARTVQKRKN